MEENNVMETNVFDTEIDEYVPEERRGNGILGKVLIGAGIVTAGAVAIYLKNKKKIEERRIEKLRKKGYVIIDPDNVCDETEMFDVEETKEN